MSVLSGMGDGLPVAPVKRGWKVIYPKPGEPIEGVLLGNSYLGLNAHWVRTPGTTHGRTVPCWLPDKCACHDAHLPAKWYAYLPLARFRDKLPCVLTLTQFPLLNLLAQAPDPHRLRGMSILVARSNSHPQSTASVMRMSREWVGTLPPNFDLFPSLEPMYGADFIRRFCERTGLKGGEV
jgi:hypothetical protein